MKHAIINSFSGEYRFLSNFWYAKVSLGGLEFKSTEAAYVAAKTTDPEIRLKIQALPKPAACKSFGRKIELRADWDEVKLPIMLDLLEQKFAAGTELAAKLLGTGHACLVEGNTWGDTFWGVCDGEGLNHLGILLMNIRADLRNEENG